MPLDVLQPVRAELPDFLKRAIVWPRPGDGSFVSMHILFTKDGRKSLPGTPCYSEQDVARFIAKNASRFDVYVCMSTQTQLKRPGRTDRKAEHAGLIKSNFVDLDVKPGDPNAYDSEAEAVADADRVVKLIGLGPPTFVIATGSGGRHLHWVHTHPLLPDRWQALQESLINAFLKHGGKPDRAVSDCSRVLRIPGTFNHKIAGHPRLVSMDPASYLQEYDTVTLETILLPYLGQGPVRTTSRRSIPKPPAFVGAVLDPAFMRSTVDPRGDDRHRPTAEDLATGCPWIADMLATGGNGHREPLWKEAMNVACHVQDGASRAHDFSKGDPRYSSADTDAKYQQQKAANLGWPSCNAIARAGSTHCAACAHSQVQNASPFHFMRVSGNPGITTAPAGTGGSAGPVHGVAVAGFTVAAPSIVVGLNGMPYGYSYGSDGRVSKKDDQGVLRPICNYTFRGGRLVEHSTTDTRLVFDTDIGQTRREVEVGQPLLSDNKALSKRLAEQDMVFNDVTPVRKFMASWIQTLQETTYKAVALPSFGWHGDGFIFDGTLFDATGETPATSAEPEISAMYSVRGRRDLWDAAVRTVLARNNPGLNVILASAFCGPLVTFSAEDGLWLHAVSPPGGNKTTANRVAVATWGKKESKLGKDDTQFSVQKKMETVRHITVFHDDLQIAPDSAGDVARFAMTITSGQGRGRLTQDAKQRPVGYWSTMYSSNGNLSVREAFSDYSRRTAAAHTRVFEILVPPVGNAGRLDMGTAMQVINKVDDNYGHAGRVFAKYLGSHRDDVEAMVTKTVNAIQSLYKCTDEERFWVCTIAVLLVGAALARHLGLVPYSDADMTAMRNYLGTSLLANRADMAEEHAEATPVATADHVNEYLNANIGECGVIVERAAIAPFTRNGRWPSKITIEVNRDNRMVWIVRSHFSDWLRQRKLAQRAVLNQLGTMGALDGMRRLCEGAQGFSSPRARLIGLSVDSPQFPGLPR